MITMWIGDWAAIQKPADGPQRIKRTTIKFLSLFTSTSKTEKLSWRSLSGYRNPPNGMAKSNKETNRKDQPRMTRMTRMCESKVVLALIRVILGLTTTFVSLVHFV